MLTRFFLEPLFRAYNYLADRIVSAHLELIDLDEYEHQLHLADMEGRHLPEPRGVQPGNYTDRERKLIIQNYVKAKTLYNKARNNYILVVGKFKPS